MKNYKLAKIVDKFIQSCNAFDVGTALTLFANDAEIIDISVGRTFKNITRVRSYLEEFFVGYKTVTKLESIEIIDTLNANTQVDFTGDFGHETGALNFTFNADGLIKVINAHLD
jgi:hypothetical protein